MVCPQIQILQIIRINYDEYKKTITNTIRTDYQ